MRIPRINISYGLISVLIVMPKREADRLSFGGASEAT